jgi:hypothetical protein
MTCFCREWEEIRENFLLLLFSKMPKYHILEWHSKTLSLSIDTLLEIDSNQGVMAESSSLHHYWLSSHFVSIIYGE